jgi:uncharacterized membrane protein YfcA
VAAGTMGGLAGANASARTQTLPELLIRRVMGILVLAIGTRYLRLGASLSTGPCFREAVPAA